MAVQEKEKKSNGKSSHQVILSGGGQEGGGIALGIQITQTLAALAQCTEDGV